MATQIPAFAEAFMTASSTTTTAHVRRVDLPGGGTAALITIDNGMDHTKPTLFGPSGLRQLDEAMDAIEKDGGINAICVTGKPFIFAAGADLTLVPHLRTREQAEFVASYGHAVFRRFADSSIPTFALVNGVAMGGGLELPLNCHYRAMSTGIAAMSLPECFLGLLPGWGGCYLLPRLIGADNAVTVIIENALSQNRQLKVKDALRMGLADVVFEPVDFLPHALAWVGAVVRGDITVSRRPLDDENTWSDAVARGRQIAEELQHGASPAPLRALELIEAARTSDMTAAYAAEDTALGELILSHELRAGLYSFDLVQRRAKRPAGAPPSDAATRITKVGVVGAGLMASQLAMLFAQRLQVPVVMTDLDQERVDRGIANVHKDIAGLLSKGRISSDKANRLTALVTGDVGLGAFADADLVIEAVFEDLDVKRALFADLEKHVRPDCILATNTSSLSVTQMGSHLSNPERVVGMHFFNPVAKMPLLEIISTPATDERTLATAFAVGKTLKKSSVLVADAPAFVVNRILTRMLAEIVAALDEGTAFETADRAMAPLGLPMTPLTLLQLVGPAVALHVNETLHAAYPDRFPVSDNLRTFVKAGKKGIWMWGMEGPYVDPEVLELWQAGSSPSDEEQLRTRVLDALAQEAALILDEGVVAESADIDLCMILGAGWPFHLGGLTPLLDRTGTSERVTGRRFAPPGVATLPE
jgi:3-hydroxyacyl-CoA dehydrogenase/enoyl-CoA hydratase/carnithine racemase